MQKSLFSIFCFFIYVTVYSQAELALQKGHASAIEQVEFSPNNKWLVSKSANNEFVIWDIALSKSLSRFYLGKIEEVRGMVFSNDEEKLYIKTKRTIYSYGLGSGKITEVPDYKSNFRTRYHYNDTVNSFNITLEKGKVVKRKCDRKLSLFKLSSRKTKSPISSFDIAYDKNLIAAISDDGYIYIYDYRFGVKLRNVYANHYSKPLDIRFSADGKTFATTGEDRSICIWDTETLKLKKRLFSKIFRKTGLQFSESGKSLTLIDELGYIYEVDMAGAYPEVRVNRPKLQALNSIDFVNNAKMKGYLMTSDNNHVYYHDDLLMKPISAINYQNFQFLKARTLFLQDVLGTYQPPFSTVKRLAISPNQENIVFAGHSERNGLAFHDLIKDRTKRIFIPGDTLEWTDTGFLNDSVFISIHDSSNVLHFWMKTEKDLLHKTDTLQFVIRDFEPVNEECIWLNSVYNGQFKYNPTTRVITKISLTSASSCYRKGNFLFAIAKTNVIEMYNVLNDSLVHSFGGHNEIVSGVSLHPYLPIFASSSFDGTAKIWDYELKQLLGTIIPFSSGEFIFITGENYYLISKGAMDQIGFKVDGKFFYPDQFDMIFNRPDIVLERLGLSDPLFIEAYQKAYEKRLKKLNFNKNQLRADFILPAVHILNKNEIAQRTNSPTITLNLAIQDTKYELDRINVWINGVAIYGIDGYSLSEMKKDSLSIDLTFDLAEGNNKIEVSALNKRGAESYKEMIEVFVENQKTKPNLFVLAIGTSKHLEAEFDLKYADKDANDLVQTFTQSNAFADVKHLTITNKEVRLSSFDKMNEFLGQAGINDVVVVFVAGHGVLDENFDYYFAAHDMNFSNPSQGGIPYSAIEKLLDGIKPLKKLLLMDTCHSGEFDKEDLERKDESINTEGPDIIFRNVGNMIGLKENPLGLSSTNDLMKFLFTDLRKGTGATVISSSGGAELSIESNEYQNGLFTYCLIDGLLNMKADLNKDKKIFVSELKSYIQINVNRLSNGIQTPTSRIENSDLDYQIW
jgi:WD40 repeat protein